MRVANIDMTNTSQNCPSGLDLITSPRRLCDTTVNGVQAVTLMFMEHSISTSVEELLVIKDVFPLLSILHKPISSKLMSMV